MADAIEAIPRDAREILRKACRDRFQIQLFRNLDFFVQEMDSARIACRRYRHRGALVGSSLVFRSGAARRCSATWRWA